MGVLVYNPELIRSSRGIERIYWIKKRLKIFISLFLLNALIFSNSSSRVENPSNGKPTEYEVKAAFIYGFANFVEWPPASSEADASLIRIGVLGKDPFSGSLEYTLQDKKVKNKEFLIKKSQRIEDLINCDVVFIGSSEEKDFAKILKALQGKHVLTVGESEGFAEKGGIINFFMYENKIRFEINTTAAERAGLKISSNLLKLAVLVEE